MSDSTNAPYLDGWHAHRLNTPSDRNPHDENTQPWSHSQWTSGWCGRFSAVKHDQPLPWDDEIGW
jgi:hypothetical protein